MKPWRGESTKPFLEQICCDKRLFMAYHTIDGLLLLRFPPVAYIWMVCNRNIRWNEVDALPAGVFEGLEALRVL